MPASEFKFGIEIEFVYNLDNTPNFYLGNYHSGSRNSRLKGWSLQSDSSLNANNTIFNRKQTAEFVSDLRRSRKGLNLQLRRFYDFFSRDGQQELNQVLCFNNSCGCHVHISPTNNTRFCDGFTIEEFEKVRRYFFNQVQNNKKLSEQTKRLVKDQYFRGYAQKIKRRSSWRHTRSAEFNVGSEFAGRGLEWRSFNLRGVRTWDEFFEMFNIMWNVMEYISRMSKTEKLVKVVEV